MSARRVHSGGGPGCPCEVCQSRDGYGRLLDQRTLADDPDHQTLDLRSALTGLPERPNTRR